MNIYRPKSCFTFTVIFLIALYGCTKASQPPTAQKASPSPTLEEQIGAAIHEHFGPQISYMTDAGPPYLMGDFNGDGFPDLAAIVDAENGRAELNDHGVIVLNVNAGSPENGRRIQPSSLGMHCAGVAIMHGTKDGWTNSDVREKFLFYQCFAPFSLIKKGSRIERGSASRGPTPKLLGDAIHLELETGGSALVYWDGSTYRGFALRNGD
jgi:hypothetical protein